MLKTIKKFFCGECSSNNTFSKEAPTGVEIEEQLKDLNKAITLKLGLLSKRIDCIEFDIKHNTLGCYTNVYKKPKTKPKKPLLKTTNLKGASREATNLKS